MRIPDPPIAASRFAEFTKAGYWRDTTSNDALEQCARTAPDKVAIVDPRGRLTYRETAILVDGGPALTDLGKFRQGLGISILFTRLVPGRFERFATNVLGEGVSEADRAELRKQLARRRGKRSGVTS